MKRLLSIIVFRLAAFSGRMYLLILCATLFLAGCATLQPRHVWTPPPPQEMPLCGTFSIPLPDSRVISGFGQRSSNFHTGVDLKKSKRGGDPVLAARAGRVESVKKFGGYGLMILLRHDDGSRSRYAHLRKAKVKAGVAVHTGDVIGTVGSSGRASTPHLHFEILTKTQHPVNPLLLIAK
jgi:murein DD-endopeptidase MepM/ murein hydrolase activator NlpD